MHDTTQKYRHQYRHYSRRIKSFPSQSYYHKQRIRIAKNLSQNEPLQGALADYFFACWYDINREGRLLLEDLSEYLPSHILERFSEYVNTGKPMQAINVLATRYSVLTSPSMNVPKDKLYVVKDDSKRLSEEVSRALIAAKNQNDSDLITQIQHEYIEHCLACRDKMGFMLTWFNLSKAGFEFDERWVDCQQQLQST